MLTQLWTALSWPLRSEQGTFGIVSAAVGASNAYGDWDGTPSNRNQFADQAIGLTAGQVATYAGCTSAFVGPVRNVRALIWMKNYTVGMASGISGLTFILQVATGAGGWPANKMDATTGTSAIDIRQAPRSTGCFILNGIVPDNGLNYQAARILVPSNNGSIGVFDSCSFDCNIDAT